MRTFHCSTRALAITILAVLAGCENERPADETDAGARHDAGATQVTARGECRLFPLANGRQVCLLTEPQGPVVEAAMRESTEGVRVEPLLDPDFVGPLPPSHDLRAESLGGCLQVRDQRECGWCVAHAAGAVLDALYCAEGCPPPRVSMGHLWSTGHGGTIGDCGFGWDVEEGMRAVTGATPLVPESTWPYTGGSRSMNDTRPSDATLMADGRYRATGYTMIPNDADKLERMKRVLASGRAIAVWSGLCWSGGWGDGQATIQAPMLPCAADGTSDYDGYHAYTIVGYDDATMEFIALNSWGQDWGQNGYMRLSYDFVQNEVAGGGYLQDIDRTHGACDVPDGGMPPGSTAERCETIGACAACAETTGCLWCDGHCVASDDTGTAPATGSCTMPDRSATRGAECSLPMDACTSNTDCASCADAPGCAWCEQRGACIAWPGGAGTCGDRRLATARDQCNDVTRACEMAADCGACTMLEGCGWCGGASGSIHSAPGTTSCFGGDATGADRASCAAGWVGPAGMCPMPPMDDAGVAEDGGVSDGGTGSDAGTGGDGGTTGPVCGMVGGPCYRDAQCCDGMQCVANACRDASRCGVEGATCANGSQCCGGLSCLPGSFGGARACCVGFEGGSCESDADCCGEMTCSGGRCLKRRAGQSCASNWDCAGTLRCNGGTCG
ncbi:C1 family peptidase [Sandaracinus amylolyticus]|uniref:C1 family peptidase n=1 Tax=Sandaracinus amylolyticus TaxID=927083 RepID=UPI001F194BDA|nr:C1 family peptidase [Sandaracinus amylolyticus]UJR78149.1 Tryptophan synthase alpha chain [Sandaracinus amylolyticus]